MDPYANRGAIICQLHMFGDKLPVAHLAPNDRYALVGKTGSGKTALAMVLAGTFARALPAPWEIWWLDTKGDKDDLRALRKWGFRNAVSPADRSPDTGGLPNALYYLIETKDGKGGDLDTIDQAQALLAQAYERGRVMVVVDEYKSVVQSDRNAGKALLDIFQRGRGKDVGLIGCTQEPVFVPRQLVSQASHICLLSLTYEYDIKYARGICPIYTSPLLTGDRYGFYWSWVDGSGQWSYYKNQRQWYEDLKVRQPKLVPLGEIPAQTA